MHPQTCPVQFKYNRLSFNIKRRSRLMYARLWCKFVPSQWSKLIEWRKTSTNAGDQYQKTRRLNFLQYWYYLEQWDGYGWFSNIEYFVWSWWKICLAFTAHDRLGLCFCGLLPSTLFRSGSVYICDTNFKV